MSKSEARDSSAEPVSHRDRSSARCSNEAFDQMRNTPSRTPEVSGQSARICPGFPPGLDLYGFDGSGRDCRSARDLYAFDGGGRNSERGSPRPQDLYAYDGGDRPNRRLERGPAGQDFMTREAPAVLFAPNASAEERLSSVRRLYDAGIHNIVCTDQDGIEHKFRLEKIPVGSNGREMVHLFAADRSGREQTVLRGIADADGNFERERNQRGRSVDYYGNGRHALDLDLQGPNTTPGDRTRPRPRLDRTDPAPDRRPDARIDGPEPVPDRPPRTDNRRDQPRIAPNDRPDGHDQIVPAGPRQAELRDAAVRTAGRLGTVGRCAAGVQMALAAVGHPEFMGSGNAWPMGQKLEQSGQFQRIPMSEAGEGDIIVRSWNRQVIAQHGGRNYGDIVVVTGRRGNQLMGANDHLGAIPPDGGRYENSYALRLIDRANPQPSQQQNQRPEQENERYSPPRQDPYRRPPDRESAPRQEDRRRPDIPEDFSVPDQNTTSRPINRERFYNNQKHSYDCGPTALGMAIGDRKLGRPPTDAEVDSLTRATGTGSSGLPDWQNTLPRQLRNQGLNGQSYAFGVGDRNAMNQLDRELALGHSAIVHVNNPLTGNGHFIYVAGRSPDGGYVIGDPNRRSNSIGHDRPISRQHLEDMMVNPPRQHPGSYRGTPGFTAVW